MKKIMLLCTMVLVALCANAQIVRSRTIVKEKSQTMWYGRIGMSFNNIAGGNDYAEGYKTSYSEATIRPKVGMNLDFGFHKPIGKSGTYWGMELGIGTRGGSFKESYDGYGSEISSITTWNVKYSPFTFGYKYSITDDLKLDAHIGAYVSYDFAGKGKTKFEDDDDVSSTLGELADDYDYQRFDAGMQIGIGAWWKRFNIDFTYQRGFVPCANVEDYIDWHKDYNLTSSNFSIRLGYAF